jgi:hypothetical protein
LSLIQGILPAVNVFFELGREGINVDTEGLAVFRLVDILKHTRLQTLEQVLTCLDTISTAARRVRGDADAAFYGLDGRGHCFVSAQTQQSTRHVWQQIIAGRDLDIARASVRDTGMAVPATFPSGTPASALSCPIWSPPGGTTNGGACDRNAPDVISP